MIKSYSYSQQEIINNILTLHNKGRSIDLDPCYNAGGFYKNGVVAGPRIKSDINPLSSGVLKLDVRELPFSSSSIKSVIFDPPFLVTGGQGCTMTDKYGSFASFEELLVFYKQSLLSLKRVLKHGGLLIFKCQDFVSGRKQRLILPYVVEMARVLNFAVRDLFVLLSKSRITSKYAKQQHARKYHCYFLVLKNNKRFYKSQQAARQRVQLALSEIPSATVENSVTDEYLSKSEVHNESFNCLRGKPSSLQSV